VAHGHAVDGKDAIWKKAPGPLSQPSSRHPSGSGAKEGLCTSGHRKSAANDGRDWIDLSLPTDNGVPIHDRGIVESCPGLYFVGLPFLYSLSSALLGGVGRDAKHIVDHIVSTQPARMKNSWPVRAEVMAGDE
jgi:hypothetical protein